MFSFILALTAFIRNPGIRPLDCAGPPCLAWPRCDAFPSLPLLSCPWVLTDSTEHTTNWGLSSWVCDIPGCTWVSHSAALFLFSFFYFPVCFSCVLPAPLYFFHSKDEIREKYRRMVLKNPWNLRGDPRAVDKGIPQLGCTVVKSAVVGPRKH